MVIGDECKTVSLAGSNWLPYAGRSRMVAGTLVIGFGAEGSEPFYELRRYVRTEHEAQIHHVRSAAST